MGPTFGEYGEYFLSEESIEECAVTPFNNNNNKTMNIFDEIEFNEFKESKNIKAVAKKIAEAKKISENFANVARKVFALAEEVESDVDMLNEYANAKEIKALNELLEILTTKLEIFEDKKVTGSVDALSTIFGINKGAKKVSKADVSKSLGL